MRVRHCAVRAVIRDPWAFGDPDALAGALTRLLTDVLAARLAAQLDRIGQTGPLPAVTLRVRLPAPVVLELAGASSAGSSGRRLASFSAELAVHHAASDAVRTAVERVGHEPTEPHPIPGPPDPPGAPPDAEPQWGGGAPGPATAPAPPRLAAAIGAALLAAARRGGLTRLLQRGAPTLLAEWVRVLATAAAVAGTDRTVPRNRAGPPRGAPPRRAGPPCSPAPTIPPPPSPGPPGGPA